jgi:hypothetical protein
MSLPDKITLTGFLSERFSSRDQMSLEKVLSALIHNYGDVLSVMFFNHRGTEDTETLFIKLCPKVIAAGPALPGCR